MKLERLFILSLGALGIVLGGFAPGEAASSSGIEGDSSSRDEGNSSSHAGEGGDALVIYFSATGNTEEVAGYIAERLSTPIHELRPVEPYTAEDLDYGDLNSRVYQERNDPDHLTELQETEFPEFREADYIFLGAPVWWGELSWVVEGFLLSNDFEGKTIVPFATASSSDFDRGALHALAPEANWLEGRRFRASEIGEENVFAWVDSLGL